MDDLVIPKRNNDDETATSAQNNALDITKSFFRLIPFLLKFLFAIFLLESFDVSLTHPDGILSVFIGFPKGFVVSLEDTPSISMSVSLAASAVVSLVTAAGVTNLYKLLVATSAADKQESFVCCNLVAHCFSFTNSFFA